MIVPRSALHSIRTSELGPCLDQRHLPFRWLGNDERRREGGLWSSYQKCISARAETSGNAPGVLNAANNEITRCSARLATHIQNVAFTDNRLRPLAGIIKGGRGKNDFHARDKAIFFFFYHLQRKIATVKYLKTRLWKSKLCKFLYLIVISFLSYSFGYA